MLKYHNRERLPLKEIINYTLGWPLILDFQFFFVVFPKTLTLVKKMITVKFQHEWTTETRAAIESKF